jgi:GxxExxY protein
METDGFPYENLTRDIIGAAMTVLNTLRPGLREKTYERALVIELRKRGHKVDQQKSFPVYYDHVQVDTFVPDLIVDDVVIVDPKCATQFTPTDLATMIGYLSITGLPLSLLLNFKEATLRWKRIAL